MGGGEGYLIEVEGILSKAARSCDTDGGWGVEKVEEALSSR